MCGFDIYCITVPDGEVWVPDPKAPMGGYWVAGCRNHRERYLADHPESDDRVEDGGEKDREDGEE